jgi:hypothetical protein
MVLRVQMLRWLPKSLLPRSSRNAPGNFQVAERKHSDQVGVSLDSAAGDADVASLEDTLWVATLRYADHGAAQEHRGGDILREQPS